VSNFAVQITWVKLEVYVIALVWESKTADHRTSKHSHIL